MELFKQKAGVDMRAIPYRGGAPAFQDLVGGQINFAISGPANCLPFIETKQLRPIGTTGSKRLAATPNIPAFAETLPGFELNEWWGVLAPLNTPADIVARLLATLGEMHGHHQTPVLAAQGFAMLLGGFFPNSPQLLEAGLPDSIPRNAQGKHPSAVLPSHHDARWGLHRGHSNGDRGLLIRT